MSTKTRTEYAIRFSDGDLDEMPVEYGFNETMDYSRSLSDTEDEDDPALYEHTVVSRTVTIETGDWEPVFANT